MLQAITYLYLSVTGPIFAANSPRVALIYSDYGEFRHRDDYDALLNDMGWPLTKFENTELAHLVARLDEFDIVLGSALFNYSNTQDFAAYRDALFAFIGRGGAIILTDCNYSQHVNWLAEMGENWRIAITPVETNPTPMGWIDAQHPLFTTPNLITEIGATWTQMQIGDTWTALARSQEGGITAAFRRDGLGFIYITSCWPLAEHLLENLWTYLQLTRAGIEVTLPDLRTLKLGRNRLEAHLTNLLPQPRLIVLELQNSPHDGDSSVVSKEFKLGPHSNMRARINMDVLVRGQHTVTARLMVDGKELLRLKPVVVRIPLLLEVTITKPWYRSAIYAANPPKEIILETAITPDPGEHVTDFELRARLANQERWATVQTGAAVSRLRVPLEGPLANDVEVIIALYRDGKAAIAKRVTLPVIQARESQVFLDERGVLHMGGEPFFPIGVYHVAIENFARLREMGFNTVVAWGNTPEGAQQALDAAQTAGLKVILELSTYLRGEYNPQGLFQVINHVRDHPALLAWYTVDEPSGMQLEWCHAARDIIAHNDPDHPVYLVSCNPDEFAQYTTSTDIFAIDPYPIPHAPIEMVTMWMKAAQEAVADSQPVWLVPQCHNLAAYRDPTQGRGPTAEEERCMVYQGLIYGAKGVIYYPWDDGPCGLVHDESLMSAVARINDELQQIGAELAVSDRRLVADSPSHLPGLHAASFVGKTHVHVIAANTSDEILEASLPIPGAINDPVEVLFERRTVQTNGGMLQDRFEPLAVHIYMLPTPH